MIALMAYAKISIRMENDYSKILVVEDEIVLEIRLKGFLKRKDMMCLKQKMVLKCIIYWQIIILIWL